MEAALGEAGDPARAPQAGTSLLEGVDGSVHTAGWTYRHTPPPAFRRGEKVRLDLTVHGRPSATVSVRLHYRRMNQSEPHVVVDVPGEAGRFRATIPGTYSDSPYPIQYWFELRDGAGRSWLWPGFNNEVSNQPYVIVRQVKPVTGVAPESEENRRV